MVVFPLPAVAARKARKKRNADAWSKHYFRKDGDMWLTSAEHNAALVEIPEKDINGNKANKLKLLKADQWFAGDSLFKRYRCAYYNRTKPHCPCEYKSEHNHTTDMYRIQFSIAAHLDHDAAYVGQGVRPKVREKIDVTTLKQAPKTIVEDLTDELHLAGADQKSLKNLVKKRKGDFIGSVDITDLTTAAKSSLGALLGIFDSRRKVNIAEFNEHSSFLLGDRFIVHGDPEKVVDPDFLVVAVFSTEELLLNARRQELTGQVGRLYVDSSFRYTHVRNVGFLTVKVVSPDRLFRRRWRSYQVLTCLLN
jgi:hypothetical protein